MNENDRRGRGREDRRHHCLGLSQDNIWLLSGDLVNGQARLAACRPADVDCKIDALLPAQGGDCLFECAKSSDVLVGLTGRHHQSEPVLPRGLSICGEWPKRSSKGSACNTGDDIAPPHWKAPDDAQEL